MQRILNLTSRERQDSLTADQHDGWGGRIRFVGAQPIPNWPSRIVQRRHPVLHVLSNSSPWPAVKGQFWCTLKFKLVTRGTTEEKISVTSCPARQTETIREPSSPRTNNRFGLKTNSLFDEPCPGVAAYPHSGRAACGQGRN